jgi:hypothetical protein
MNLKKEVYLKRKSDNKLFLISETNRQKTTLRHLEKEEREENLNPMSFGSWHSYGNAYGHESFDTAYVKKNFIKLTESEKALKLLSGDENL